VIDLLLSAGKAQVLICVALLLCAAGFDGRTALMLASVKRHRDVVDLLLSAGEARTLNCVGLLLCAADYGGCTALMLVSVREHRDVVDLLLSAAAACIFEICHFVTLCCWL
jgi:ankyrin repeat protein